MADFGVGEVIALAGVATSAYAASQAGGPKAPKVPVTPKLPESKAVAASTDAAEAQARSAGGTILSDQRKNAVGDGANAVRKSLLGT